MGERASVLVLVLYAVDVVNGIAIDEPGADGFAERLLIDLPSYLPHALRSNTVQGFGDIVRGVLVERLIVYIRLYVFFDRMPKIVAPVA